MKKLNVAILTLLLVFQTVLSPISVLAVDAPVNNSETGETASTNTSEQTPTEPSTGELETQAPVADEVVSKPVDIVQQDLAASLDPSVIDEDAAADQMGTLNAPEGTAFVPSSMQSDIEMTFAGLKLYNNSNSLIKDATDLGNFTGNSPKKGDTVYLYYEFKVDPTKDYGIGSTFTFQLPEYMIEEFSPGSFTQKRTIDQTGGWAAYTATYNSGSKRVTFTLDSDLESTSPGEVKFEYQAKFGNFQDESKLDQELVIPVEGKTPVEIEFTFDPKGSGDLLTKQAGNISRAADGTVTIPWTLWVNTGGKKLSSAQLADVTDGKHALDGVITVERYAVGLNGFDQDNPGTPVQTTPNAFPLTLDDGYYAYKVTYTTKVTEAPTKTNMTYTNTATLTGTGITTTPKTGSKPVTYGPSLLKTKGGDKYSSKWTIKYNWLGQQIDATKANLTDTMTKTTGSGTHKIDYTSLKVYQVTLSADGQSASNQTLLTAGTHYDLTNKTDQGFNLDFAKSKNNDNKVTAAYLIEYDANLIDEFVTDANDGTVTNTVTRADTSESKSDSINLTPAIFSKSGGQLGTVDYIDKIITWTVTINAERDLKNFAITDNFTTTNNDGKTLEHALTQWGKEDPDYFKVTGANGLVYSIKDLSNGNPNAGNKGFKVNFTSDIPKGTKITIQYKTKFDFEPNGGVAKSYDNTAKATWDGAKSTDNEASRDSSYTPDPESPTTKNGYKKWSVDNSAQEFSWLIGMNINKQDIDGATLTDTLGAGHYIDVPTGKTLKDQIMISKLNLTTEEGEKYSPNQLLGEANWDVTPTLDPSGKVIGFVITFKGLTGDNAQNKQPYLVEYKSKDIDDIYGQDSGNKNQYTNGAELDTPNNGLYNYSATATISNEANELISKTAAVNTAADTIKWTVKVNTSNSKLGSITLTDKPSTNQKLLTGTFTKQKVQLKVDGTLENVGNPEVIAASEIMLTGKDTSNNPITVSSTDPVPAGVTLDGGFSLDLGELNGEGYIIEYHTFFMGDPNVGEKVSNSASIGYAGAESAGTTDDDVEEANFKYSSSDTNASPKKGSLQLKKFKVNPLTGVREKFQGVKFELWNRNGTIKLDEGTTDADGTVTFKNLRYGIYTVKETTPAGYKPMADLSVTLKDAVNIADGGKAYVVENIEDVDLSSACSTFELTIKDIDGAAVANTAIQLKDSNGDVKYTGATDGTGKVNDIKRPGTGGKEVQAGEYTVVDTGTNKELGQIIVKYGDGCKGSI
ncbi:MAG: collagen binding domain-containing protein, partial [Lysinibacillus sp.]